MDDLKEKFDEFLEGVTGKFEEVKEDTRDLVKKGKARMEEAMDGQQIVK